MPSLRYTIIIDADLKGADRTKAILDQLQEQTEEGLGELQLTADTRMAEDAKQVILEIEELAETPARIQIDSAEAVQKAEQLGQELDRVLSDRKVKVDTQIDNVSTQDPTPKTQDPSGSIASDAAIFASLQDLQEQAGKGLADLKLGGDTAKIEEMRKLIEEVDALAKQPSNFELDTDAAAEKAAELKARLEELTTAAEAEQRVKINVDDSVRGAKRAKEAIEDLQDLARRGLDDLDLEADPSKAEELEQIIKDIDALARRPKKLAIDNKDAIRDAKELEKRIENIGKKGEKKVSFLDKLKTDLKDLRTEIPLLGKGFDLLEIAARGPIALLVGAIAGITLGWKGATAATRAYLAQAPKFAEFDAVLAQHAQLTDEIRKRYIGVASAMQDATNIADDQWIEVISRLIQFGSKPESIGVDLEAVKNLAAFFKGDAKRAVELYTRALAGQFSQFTEIGIIIDQNASQTEKLGQLQREAAEKGGAILEAQTRTNAGEMAAFTNELGDTVEAVGRLIGQSAALNGVVSTFRNQLSLIRSVLPDAVDQLDGLQNKLPDLAAQFNTSTDAAKTLAQEGIDEVAQASARAAKQLAAYISYVRELEGSEIAKEQAKLGDQIAQVNLEEAQGKITPLEADERRFQLKETSEEKITKIKQTGIAAERKAIEASLKDEETELSEIRSNLERIRAEREQLFSEIINPAKARKEALDTEQAAVRAEREQIETRQPERIPEDTFPAIKALPDFAVNDFEREERETRRNNRKRLGELNARDKELNAIAAEGFSPEEEDAAKRGQQLENELLAGLEVLKKAEEDFNNLFENQKNRLRSLALEEETLETTAPLQKSAQTKNFKAARVEPEREAKLLSESQALGNRAGSLSGDFELQRNQGRNPETDREFNTRNFRAGELVSEINAAKKSLQDGADQEELQELSLAIRELLSVIGQDSRNSRDRAALSSLQREVERLKSQILNNR